MSDGISDSRGPKCFTRERTQNHVNGVIKNGYQYCECRSVCVAVFPEKKTSMTLPTDSNERKNIPIVSGCIKYFPAALAGVARISKLGNDKHNPGEPMHHARGKSTDHADCVVRHLIDVQDLLAADNSNSEQVLLEVSQLCWRALALSQELHEKYGAPLAPGAKGQAD